MTRCTGSAAPVRYSPSFTVHAPRDLPVRTPNFAISLYIAKGRNGKSQYGVPAVHSELVHSLAPIHCQVPTPICIESLNAQALMHHSPTLDPFKLIPRALPLPAIQALRLLMQGRHGAVAHFPKTRICPAQIWVVDRRSCQV